ncbi:glutathione S-transferase family protein [Erythrobacter sp. YT30]|uniref:glutathione S-transferase family protein n=1 Tax=Erythrobacter sp. YT30 TaxID=1735012 RepID=UPI00076DDDB1|nr:glutathione S-transferase family protein [Erythrobacter sp. YT30]KWV91652.1 glutathione S-transferase [Erythrobacter sp. YT30]
MSDTTPDLVFYGSPVSPFVRKVAGLCLEKDVPFEIEAVDVFNPPEWFLEISPMKRIPVMRDRSTASEGRDGTIADSSAICGYIEKKHPSPPLYPTEPFAHGRALFLEEYADTALAAGVGLGIFRPIFFALMQGKEPDLAKARSTWADDMPAILDHLDSALSDTQYFAGDSLSIADISVTCCFMQAQLVANTPLDKWANFKAHFDMMSERPSIAEPFGKAERFIRKALPERFDLT